MFIVASHINLITHLIVTKLVSRTYVMNNTIFWSSHLQSTQTVKKYKNRYNKLYKNYNNIVNKKYFKMFIIIIYKRTYFMLFIFSMKTNIPNNHFLLIAFMFI